MFLFLKNLVVNGSFLIPYEPTKYNCYRIIIIIIKLKNYLKNLLINKNEKFI